jgi:hypothetical protein
MLDGDRIRTQPASRCDHEHRLATHGNVTSRTWFVYGMWTVCLNQYDLSQVRVDRFAALLWKPYPRPSTFVAQVMMMHR